MIAVIMGAPDYKIRFEEAKKLLDYGFASCQLYRDEEMPVLPQMEVRKGVAMSVPLKYGGEFSYLSINGEDLSAIEKNLRLPESIEAPVEENSEVGELVYSLEGKELGKVKVMAAGRVERAGFLDYMEQVWRRMFL